MKLYESHGCISPKYAAQRNLMGRTHYVDDDTLRYHKARILSARPVSQGLLYAIVESIALVMDGSKRGYRYVIFDLFGNVIGTRRSLEDCWKSSATAEKAMWKELNAIDAKEFTFHAIADAIAGHDCEMEALRATVEGLAP